MSKGKRPKLPGYAHMAADLGTWKKKHRQAVAGYVHPFDGVGAHFHLSMVQMVSYDRGNGQHLAGFVDETSGAQITTARNKVVKAFLEQESWNDVEWLWLIDADMSFDADTLARLLEAADPVERPIVGGLCFSISAESRIEPTLYRYDATLGNLTRIFDYPEGLVPVDATGAACLLVHRSVLVKLAELHTPPWPWFQETPTGDQWGDSLSEDITFCLRARAAEFPVHVDTRVKLGHVKPVVLDEDAYRAQRPPQEPPATTFVVVPVKGRHELTDHLLGQLVEQEEFEQVFLFDNGSDVDPYEQLRKGGVDLTKVLVIPAAGMTITEMWSDGVRRALERVPGGRCNIAILNNDLNLQCDHFLGRLAHGLRAAPRVLASYPNYDGREFEGELLSAPGTFKNGGMSGFAFMVRGEVFAAGALAFDEAFRWYYGDDDLVAQIEKLGGMTVMVKSALIEHIGGGSQTSSAGTNKRLGTPELEAATEADGKTMLAKWGHY